MIGSNADWNIYVMSYARLDNKRTSSDFLGRLLSRSLAMATKLSSTPTSCASGRVQGFWVSVKQHITHLETKLNFGHCASSRSHSFLEKLVLNSLQLFLRTFLDKILSKFQGPESVLNLVTCKVALLFKDLQFSPVQAEIRKTPKAVWKEV